MPAAPAGRLMLRGRAVLAVVAVLASGLAGCASGGGGPAEGDLPALQATSTTGVIRAVVVDEAIRPLPGVEVVVHSGATQVRAQATDENGFAGFEGLTPGTYILGAAKTGFQDAQTPVEVVAGVPDPPVAKLQLLLLAGELPSYVEFKIEAFLECSAGPGNWCFIANYYPCLAMQAAGQPCLGNLTNDNSFFEIPLAPGRAPDWLQGELVWQSTQAAFTYMYWRFDIDDPATPTLDFTPGATGPSPLLVTVANEDMVKFGLTFNSTLAVEAFHAGSPAVCDNDPTGGDVCIYTGAAVEQRFSYILHAFYGYTPPEGWRFTTDGTVPPPP